MLKEEMEYMGPVRMTDVEGAQSKIVSIIRHLEDTGEIVIARVNDNVIVDNKVYYEEPQEKKSELPYNANGSIIANSDKKAYNSVDDKILAVSLFGAGKKLKKIIFNKLNFSKKLKVKSIIKNLEEVLYDDVLEAQTAVTVMLENYSNKKDFDSQDDLFLDK